MIAQMSSCVMQLNKNVLQRSYCCNTPKLMVRIPAAYRRRVRGRDCRTNPAEETTSAAAAVGGPRLEIRPNSRRTAHGGSKRSKAKKAASKPAKQPEKQPASHMPVEAPAPHRNETACFQQPPAHVELPPQTNADQSTVQTPVVQDQSRPV